MGHFPRLAIFLLLDGANVLEVRGKFLPGLVAKLSLPGRRAVPDLRFSGVKSPTGPNFSVENSNLWSHKAGMSLEFSSPESQVEGYSILEWLHTKRGQVTGATRGRKLKTMRGTQRMATKRESRGRERESRGGPRLLTSFHRSMSRCSRCRHANVGRLAATQTGPFLTIASELVR